jgi:hypothetical protein
MCGTLLDEEGRSGQGGRQERPWYSGRQRTSSRKCLEARRLELEMKWLKTVWQMFRVRSGDSRLWIIKFRDIGTIALPLKRSNGMSRGFRETGNRALMRC